MENEIGSIEVGKLADMQLLDLEDFHAYPSYDADLFSRVVYAATRGDVDTVIIDGEIVMQGKIVRTIDRKRVLNESDRVLKGLLSRIG
jgi:5-methylthioadenosine/S-adenosylhomocysteine deaminase